MRLMKRISMVTICMILIVQLTVTQVFATPMVAPVVYHGLTEIIFLTMTAMGVKSTNISLYDVIADDLALLMVTGSGLYAVGGTFQKGWETARKEYISTGKVTVSQPMIDSVNEVLKRSNIKNAPSLVYKGVDVTDETHPQSNEMDEVYNTVGYSLQSRGGKINIFSDTVNNDMNLLQQGYKPISSIFGYIGQYGGSRYQTKAFKIGEKRYFMQVTFDGNYPYCQLYELLDNGTLTKVISNVFYNPNEFLPTFKNGTYECYLGKVTLTGNFLEVKFGVYYDHNKTTNVFNMSRPMKFDLSQSDSVITTAIQQPAKIQKINVDTTKLINQTIPVPSNTKVYEYPESEVFYTPTVYDPIIPSNTGTTTPTTNPIDFTVTNKTLADISSKTDTTNSKLTQVAEQINASTNQNYDFFKWLKDLLTQMLSSILGIPTILMDLMTIVSSFPNVKWQIADIPILGTISSALDGVKTGINSIANWTTNLVKDFGALLEGLFIPDLSVIKSAIEALTSTLKNKLGLIYQAFEVMDRIVNNNFGEFKKPRLVIKLDPPYGNGSTYDILDLTFFDQYRPKIMIMLNSIVWFMFFRKVANERVFSGGGKG